MYRVAVFGELGTTRLRNREANGGIEFHCPSGGKCDRIATTVRGGKAHFGRRIASQQRSERVRIGGQLRGPRDTPRRVSVEMGLWTKKAFGDHGRRCDGEDNASRRTMGRHVAAPFGGDQKTRPGLPLRVDRVASGIPHGRSTVLLRTDQAHARLFFRLDRELAVDRLHAFGLAR